MSFEIPRVSSETVPIQAKSVYRTEYQTVCSYNLWDGSRCLWKVKGYRLKELMVHEAKHRRGSLFDGDKLYCPLNDPAAVTNQPHEECKGGPFAVEEDLLHHIEDHEKEGLWEDMKHHCLCDTTRGGVSKKNYKRHINQVYKGENHASMAEMCPRWQALGPGRRAGQGVREATDRGGDCFILIKPARNQNSPDHDLEQRLEPGAVLQCQPPTFPPRSLTPTGHTNSTGLEGGGGQAFPRPNGGSLDSPTSSADGVPPPEDDFVARNAFGTLRIRCPAVKSFFHPGGLHTETPCGYRCDVNKFEKHLENYHFSQKHQVWQWFKRNYPQFAVQSNRQFEVGRSPFEPSHRCGRAIVLRHFRI
ncbi:hypothetical protein T439DRAFT_97818 [Meredithblackwellia eburnea MCA 4105]